jgi:hypothetical protein
LVGRPGSPGSAHRCLVYGAVLVGKPGRSLCQDVALLGDLTQLPAQLGQLLALSRCQWRLRPAATYLIGFGLTNPSADAGFMTSKLLGQFAGFASNASQLDHLMTKFRRIRPFSLTHF